MSKIDFQQLNTLDGFKGFLSAYHSQLSETRSFPPLGLQKALHTAAPVFGYNDWHVMSAALDAVEPAAAPANPEPERISVIVVTLVDKNADGALEYVDNNLYRTWAEAKDYVSGILHNKVSGRDVERDEWNDYSFISYPDAEDMDEMDDQELLEWIVERNDIHSLCELVEMVDDELTDLSCKETYL